MSISNRDRAIFNRFSAAMEENARSDKSQAAAEFRKEREAWERAAGGKQKLEQAECLLIAARSEASKIVADASAAAAATRKDSAARFAAERVVSAKKEIALRERVSEAKKEGQDQSKKRASLLAREADVRGREDAASKREIDVSASEKHSAAWARRLDRREADLNDRDARVRAAVA